MKEVNNVKCEARIINNNLFERLLRVGRDEDQKNDSSSEDVVPLGGFFEDGQFAWMSYKNRLIVFNTKTCDLQSLWSFSTNVSFVTTLPSLPGAIPLLLVGLDNGAGRMKDSIGMLCVFNCCISRVLRAIRMPAGVEQICVLHNGRDWDSYNCKSDVLNNHDGLLYVALRNFQHLIIDLKRSDWTTASLESVCNESEPAEIELLSLSQALGQPSPSSKHHAYNLMNSQIEHFLEFNRSHYESQLPPEKFTTSCETSAKIDCLIVGCLGRLIIWQNDATIRWISPAIDENVAVTHLALLEPIDDPKPFYYLTAVYQNSDSPPCATIRMYTMAFERKSCDNGVNFYRKLEADPTVKFQIEWEDHFRIVSLQAIERNGATEKRDFPATRGEECLLLVGTENRMMLFDLNQWYKEHMPSTLMSCANPNSIAVTYQVRAAKSAQDKLLNYSYVPASLKQFQRYVDNQREELFYPNSLSIEWMELRIGHIALWKSWGVQAELLRDIVSAGSIILQQPTEAFHRCLSVGLVPFNLECAYSSDLLTQRETLLSLCLEQRMIGFLVKCAREWSDGSSSYLFPTFLRWAVQRATSIKQVADCFCTSLFDNSRLDIDESELKIIRFCCKQLEWLSTILSSLPTESADLKTQQKALKRVSTYLDVLIWFYDFGLLPEFPMREYNEMLPGRILYPYEKLSEYYEQRRQEHPKLLFIDEFISREFPSLQKQWQNEGESCHYPPPSLQSLLRIFLADLDDLEEMEIKHQITMYVLIDVATFFKANADVDELILYPASFKLKPELIKLVEAFYLLDHKDYSSFQETLYKFVPKWIMKDWHHQLIIQTLLHDNEHSMLMNYFRVRKPPLPRAEDQEILIDMTVKHGLVNAAFHLRPPSDYGQLLRCFFRACKNYGKLPEILYLNLSAKEEEAFIQFLDDNNCHDFRMLYNLQKGHYTKQRNVGQGQGSAIVCKMVEVYAATLPNIVKRFRACADKLDDKVDDGRSLKPLSHASNRVKSRDVCEVLMEKTQEFNKRISGSTNYIPFVSAPVSSLKSNNDMNIYHVEYPQKKVALKRKSEVILTPEDGVQSPKRSKSNIPKDSSICADATATNPLSMRTFTSTPLVKRSRTPFLSSQNLDAPTPHSILKMRQLVRKSTSLGNDSKTCRNILQGKSARQIRFHILQNDDCEMNYDDEKVEIASSKQASRTEKWSLDSELSQGPRPRPSLRRSDVGLSDRSSVASNRLSLGSSVLSNTAYLSSVLNSNTDIELSINRTNKTEVKSIQDKSEFNTSKVFRYSIGEQKTWYESSILSSDTDVSRYDLFKKSNEDKVVKSESSEEKIVYDVNDDSEEKKDELKQEKEDVEEEHDESFVSVAGSLDNEMSEKEKELSVRPTDEGNMTDDEMDEANVRLEDDKKKYFDANITDDESNDVGVFVKSKVETKEEEKEKQMEEEEKPMKEEEEEEEKQMEEEEKQMMEEEEEKMNTEIENIEEPVKVGRRVSRKLEIKKEKDEEGEEEEEKQKEKSRRGSRKSVDLEVKSVKSPSRRRSLSRTVAEEEDKVTKKSGEKSRSASKEKQEDKSEEKKVTRKKTSRAKVELKDEEEEETVVEEIKESSTKKKSVPKEKKTVKTGRKKAEKVEEKVEEEKEEEEEKVEDEPKGRRVLRSRSTTPERTLRVTRSTRAQSVSLDVSDSSSIGETKKRLRRAQSVTLETVNESEETSMFSKKSTRRSQPVQSERSGLRRTRSSSSLSKVEAILEQSVEEEAKDTVKQSKSKVGRPRKTATRRKKTTSESSCNENEDEVQFEFSLPDTKDDIPTIQEEQVPAERFEFSPPHTRSRYQSRAK